jgi:lysozyme
MVIRTLLAGLLPAAATAGAVVGSASAAAAVCGHSGAQPTLRQGSTGEDTVEAQCGPFGPARVRVFQQCASARYTGGAESDRFIAAVPATAYDTDAQLVHFQLAF